MNLVITGGHHTSALPIIEELRKRDSGLQIWWFGHKYSLLGDSNTTLEYRQITALNIPFIDLKAGKVYKTFNLARILKIPFGVFQSLFLLAKIKPDLILSFGGYLAAPAVLAGWILRIPSITHEQTVVAGYANSFIAHFVDKIMISWPQSAKFFPKNKVLFTGIPVRPSIFKIISDNFTINPKLPTLYITCGKTGSHNINLVVKEALEDLLKICNVIHQCGDNSEFNDYEKLISNYEKIKNLASGQYFLRKFVMEDEIGEAFNKANLVVTRGGANIVGDLLALEKPAIVIPIPWVSHNEQFENAKLLEKSGLGIVVEEKNLSAESLKKSIVSVTNNLTAYSLKDVSYTPVVNENANQIIASEVLKYAPKSH